MKNYLYQTEAARYLKLNPQVIMVLCKVGYLPYKKVQGRFRISKEDILKLEQMLNEANL